MDEHSLIGRIACGRHGANDGKLGLYSQTDEFANIVGSAVPPVGVKERTQSFPPFPKGRESFIQFDLSRVERYPGEHEPSAVVLAGRWAGHVPGHETHQSAFTPHRSHGRNTGCEGREGGSSLPAASAQNDIVGVM